MEAADGKRQVDVLCTWNRVAGLQYQGILLYARMMSRKEQEEMLVKLGFGCLAQEGPAVRGGGVERSVPGVRIIKME